MTDRELIGKVLKARPEDLSGILQSEEPDEQRVLRSFFGKVRYGRMRRLAQECEARKQQEKRGTVFLLPGILGSELWLQGTDEIWLDALRIVSGEFDRLQVQNNGSSVERIFALGHIKVIYSEMALSLSRQWHVVIFPYDWRLEIRDSAKDLKQLVDRTLRPGEPLYFVTHSMGALVVRSMLQQYPTDINRLKQFVMLASPSYGTFAIPLLYFGLNEVFRLIAIAQSLAHSRRELMDWAKMYVGTYQMLPFVGHHPAAPRLCDPMTYGCLNPPAPRFVNAKNLQIQLIAGVEDPPPPQNPLVAKMTSVVGYGFPTACDVRDWKRLDSRWAYKMTDLGDGNISHFLGLIKGATTYYINEKHDWVPANPTVIQAVEDLLASGSTNQLPTDIPDRPQRSSFWLQVEAWWQDLVVLLQLLFVMGASRLLRWVRPQGHSWAESRAQHLLYGGRYASRHHR